MRVLTCSDISAATGSTHSSPYSPCTILTFATILHIATFLARDRMCQQRQGDPGFIFAVLGCYNTFALVPPVLALRVIPPRATYAQSSILASRFFSYPYQATCVLGSWLKKI